MPAKNNTKTSGEHLLSKLSRSNSHHNEPQPEPVRQEGTHTAPHSRTQSPVRSERPPLPHSQSHPGPAPKSKQPRREFGVHRRVQRKPGTQQLPPSPPSSRVQSPFSHAEPQPHTHQAGSPYARDFAHLTSSAAHSQPTRKKPVYSLHEADPSVKGRPEVIYTDEELLKRLNTIGEENPEDCVDRVRTVEQQKMQELEEQRLAKERKEMEEWERKEAKRARKQLSRGWSWKGISKAVGLADGKK